MKLKFSLVLIIVFEIIILVNSPVARSYSISQSSEILDRFVIEDDEDFKIFEKGLNVLIGFFTIKQIGSVSAEVPSLKCCPETTEGAICQDVLDVEGINCAKDLLDAMCDQTASCKTGCCIDPVEGLCSTNSVKVNCESDGGVWRNNAQCLVPECQRGCCVLGEVVEFVTPARCERLSALFGFEKDFRDYQTELECIILQENQDMGACMVNENLCEFDTELECIKMGGTFYENYLCSNPDLNTDCEKQKSFGCIDGKDEVYWFDSCGNRENIYSSDKEESWNEGRVLDKSRSCGVGNNNINSDCGNCNYFLGSMCSGKEDEAKCGDINCVDENGNKRANGESWCVYDGFIGDGKDVVGSRHWLRMCIDGEIKVEPCADYRGQICVQSEIKNNETSKTYTTASCVVNEALKCIEYNSKNDMEKRCEANSDCMIKEINVDSGFKFNVCVGKYPRGFDLTGQKGVANNQQLCSLASQKCTMVYEKKIDGSWKCVQNCKCKSAEFTKQMNDLCISLGDCGSYVNYIGDGSDNIRVSGAPDVSWKDYTDYAEPVEGQYAVPKDLREMLEGDWAFLKAGALGDVPAILEIFNLGSMILGGTGLAISAVSFVADVSVIMSIVPNIGTIGAAKMAFAESVPFSTLSQSLQPIGQAMGTLGIMVGVSSLLTMAFGFQGDAAIAMAVAGGVAGVTTIALSAYLYGAAPSCFGPQALLCAIVVLVLVVFAVILSIAGIGDTKEKIVEFKCYPWEAPTGGENCNLCEDDPLRPCSEYRCSSLGQACRLLNAYTENADCAAIEKNDGRPPEISPGDISAGFEFVDEEDDRVAIKTSNGECIREFQQVQFSLETDKYAQCRFDYERKEYDEMAGDFSELNAYVKNHTSGFVMPSIASLEVYNVSGDIREKFGNLDMYIRCQDVYGNQNEKDYAINFCVKTGEDLTAAAVVASDPADGSYLEYGVTEKNLTIYVNEPAECKYSKNPNQSYDLMENTMDCATEVLDYSDLGWACSEVLTGLTENENNIYIKCKDQPWLPQNNLSRNVNVQDVIYTLYKSASVLKIDSISPDGIIEKGFEPVSEDLIVETSGGAENGKAACYYSFSEEEANILFLTTYSDSHKQNFPMLVGGEYIIYIRCEDVAGNEAYDKAMFKLNIDNTPPEIVRIYHEGLDLKIITDEPADCYYSLESCRFNFENGTSMTTGFSTYHSTPSNLAWTYHVKCKDIWGNTNPGCAAIIKPGLGIES